MADTSTENLNEILVDLNEVESVPHQTTHPSLSYESLENIENGQEKNLSVLDMSPFGLRQNLRDPIRSFNSTFKQVSKELVFDCPTGILVDFDVSKSSSINSSLNSSNGSYCIASKTCTMSENLSPGFRIQEQENNNSKEYSPFDDSGNINDFHIEKSGVSPPRPHWKTPSPQSMSRISKEVSEIIQKLNTSTLFEEDSLLCEEILPIPISFDNFDLDDNSELDKKNSDLSGASQLPVCNQAKIEVAGPEINKPVAPNCSSSNVLNISKDKESSTQSPAEQNAYQVNLTNNQDSNEFSLSSDDFKSPEITCDSADNLVATPEDDFNEVFIKKSIVSEDKENVQDRVNGCIKANKMRKNCNPAQKNSFKAEKSFQYRSHLKNLSNIKQATDSGSFNKPCKKSSVPSSKQSLRAKATEFLTPQKPQLKKSASLEPQTESKLISRLSFYQHNGRRETISSFREPYSFRQKAGSFSKSEYKSSSSEAEHSFVQMKTPSKRYSIATPMKSASVKKPSLTPAISSIQNPSAQRFMPQSLGRNRLSFSKSFQQCSSVSSFKGLRHQNSTTASPAVFKPLSNGINLPKPNKRILNQSISTFQNPASNLKAASTSSKKRVCSKLSLPSPFLAEQDRKLARTLFPSLSTK